LITFNMQLARLYLSANLVLTVFADSRTTQLDRRFKSIK